MGSKKIWILSMGLWMVCGLAGAQSSSENTTDPKSIFEKGYIQVIGISEEGQSKPKALRVAQLVAQRTLLETLQGIQLNAKTTVKKGMLESDEIRTSVEGFIQGATQCGETYHQEKGYGEVCLRMKLNGPGGVYEMFMPLFQNPSLWADQAPPATLAAYSVTKSQEIKPFATSLPTTSPAYDGVIVDVRNFNFKPALANRILNPANEIVFGPTRIATNILVERGCGGFTTELNKAKAILSQWGSTSPLVLVPLGLEQSTDVRISEEDATLLLLQDQQNALLAQAKVIYLLQ